MLIIYINKYYLLISTLSPPFRRANNSITSLLAILIHPFDAFFRDSTRTHVGRLLSEYFFKYP